MRLYPGWILFAFFLFLSLNGNASVCPKTGPLDMYQYNQYEVIFSGELLPDSLQDFGGLSWFREPLLRVTEVHKARDLKIGDTIQIKWLTHMMVGDFYPSHRAGSSWLIYAFQPDGGQIPYRLPCSRSRPLACKENYEEAMEGYFGPQEEELAFLREMKTKRNDFIEWKGKKGNERAKGQLEEGYPVGEWTYSRKGIEVASGSYEKGRKIGNWIFHGCESSQKNLLFYSNEWRNEQVYVKGFPNGMERTYFADNSPRSEGLIYTDFYSYSGSPMRGDKIGPWKEWYKNGNLKSSGSYALRGKSGIWEEYREDGTLATLTRYELCLNDDFLMDCEVSRLEFKATRKDQKRARKILDVLARMPVDREKLLDFTH